MKIGPATLVTAAFIGPGTVTVCSVSGFQSGYSFLWVMVVAVIVAVTLQGMSARLGLITGRGLSEAVSTSVNQAWAKVLSFFLIISAIAIGNAAYEAGNIVGASLGLETILGQNIEIGSLRFSSLVFGLAAFVLLWFGKYKIIEKLLIGIVGLMAVCFLTAAILVRPSIPDLLVGLTIPKIPNGDVLSVVALIGTTVVPYNLFLHAAAVKERWKDPKDLKEVRQDNTISIVLGGLISTAVIVVAAAASGTINEISNAADLASGLAPVFGPAAKYAIAIGLVAAGLSSTITAPLAAAYAISGLFDGDKRVFRVTWIIILLTGMVFSSIGYSPIAIITYAQVANGLLLPIIAAFVIWLVNRQAVMGKYKNNIRQNILAGIVLLATVALSIRTFVNLVS